MVVERLLYEEIYNDNNYMETSLNWLSTPKGDGSYPNEYLEHILLYSGIYPYTKKQGMGGVYPTPHELVRMWWFK